MNKWYTLTMHRPRDANTKVFTGSGYVYVLDPGETTQHWDKRNKFWMLVLSHLLYSDYGFKRVHIQPQRRFTYVECKIFCSSEQYNKLIREIINLGLDEYIFIN